MRIEDRCIYLTRQLGKGQKKIPLPVSCSFSASTTSKTPEWQHPLDSLWCLLHETPPLSPKPKSYPIPDLPSLELHDISNTINPITSKFLPIHNLHGTLSILHRHFTASTVEDNIDTDSIDIWTNIQEWTRDRLTVILRCGRETLPVKLRTNWLQKENQMGERRLMLRQGEEVITKACRKAKDGEVARSDGSSVD